MLANGLTPVAEEVRDSAGVKQTLEWFQTVVKDRADKTKPGHEVLVGYLENDEFNAFAATIDGHDVIALNIGVLKLGRGALIKNVNTDIPWLKARKFAQGEALLERATQFVFMHELGHIWNGHTSFANQYLGLRVLDELRVTASLSAEQAVDWQTLEMDADGYAAANMVENSIGQSRDHPDSFKHLDLEFDKTYGASASAVAESMFAMYLVWRMFDEAFDAANLKAADHPSAPMRQRIIVGATAAALVQRHGYSIENAYEMLLIVARVAETFHSAAAGRAFDAGAFKSAMEDTGYLNSLLRNWADLRPRLEKLKRGGNLPPVQEV